MRVCVCVYVWRERVCAKFSRKPITASFITIITQSGGFHAETKFDGQSCNYFQQSVNVMYHQLVSTLHFTSNIY